MNKKELAAELVSDELVKTQKNAEDIVTTIFDSIAEAVKSGADVNIPRFGIFKPHIQSARVGRNPANGKALNIPEKKVVKFKPSKAFKDLLN